MFDLAPNPYGDPIKKFFAELRGIKWKIPFLLQAINALITLFIILVLVVLYLTIGIISQISTTFWDLIVGMGEKISFSYPIESSAYSIALIIYFVLFLPFFILQSPIWLSGWLTSKIGFKPFIAILFIFSTSAAIYYYSPETATDSYAKIIALQDSIRKEYFTSDSVKVVIPEAIVDEVKEVPQTKPEKLSKSKKRKTK